MFISIPYRIYSSVGNSFACVDGYYLDGTTNSCIKCEPNCKLCTGVNKCTACSSGFYVSSGTCLRCPYNCIDCNSSGACTSCVSSAITRNNNYPLCTCLSGYFETCNHPPFILPISFIFFCFCIIFAKTQSHRIAQNVIVYAKHAKTQAKLV